MEAARGKQSLDFDMESPRIQLKNDLSSQAKIFDLCMWGAICANVF